MSPLLQPLGGIATVVLTYTAHSVAACSLAWMVCRALSHPQDRDLVWKTALVAPLLTTLLALMHAGGLVVDVPNVVRRAGGMRMAPRSVLVKVLDDGHSRDVVRHVDDPVMSVLILSAIAVACCCVVLALIRLMYRRRALLHALAGRRAVGELPLLVRGAAVAISSAPRLVSPVALGGREICLPAGAFDDLTDEHRRSLIAHELAHLQRRDPFWFFAFEVLTALTAFQPLAFVIARAFRRDVELICDEAAVRDTNDRSALIGALARLAESFDARWHPAAAATAYDGSPLVARATRIASLSLGIPARGVHRGVRLGVIVAIGLLCLSPVLSATPRLGDRPFDPLGTARRAGRPVIVDTIVRVDVDYRRTIVRIR